MDKLLFGDNQFFGINHMSEERARAQSLRFQEFEAVRSVLDSAYEEGIHTFMCTTHDRIAEVVKYVAADSERYPEFQFYPCMPYAHKYANAVTEDGMIGALRRFLPSEGILDSAKRGGASIARKDIEGLITLLVDAEMKMFEGVRTPVIFLQNIVVDLVLGIGVNDAFRIFDQHVRARYRAEPGYITMNMPKLLDVLTEIGITQPIVCTNLNKIGFRMSGGIDQYKEYLDSKMARVVAMSIFASGAIPPDEAVQWVCAQGNIESIVFGASSRSNIQATRALVEKYWNREAKK